MMMLRYATTAVMWAAIWWTKWAFNKKTKQKKTLTMNKDDCETKTSLQLNPIDVRMRWHHSYPIILANRRRRHGSCIYLSECAETSKMIL